MEKKKYSIKEYIARRIQAKEKEKSPEERNQEKLDKAREEFYLK